MQNLTEREKILSITKLGNRASKELDIVQLLAKAEGNLQFLAEVSNSSNWQGSITQGQAILDALNFVQQAANLHTELRNSK
jgi:indole-3-glycerol phosphate synthase